MTRFLFIFTLVGGIFLLTRCSNQNGNGGTGSAQCNSNFQGSSLSLSVAHTHDTTYSFTLCSDIKPAGTVFTVYGVSNSSNISSFNTGTSERLAHIADAQKTGDHFEVTFLDSDVWFVIDADQMSQNSYTDSTSTELARGDLANAAIASVALLAN